MKYGRAFLAGVGLLLVALGVVAMLVGASMTAAGFTALLGLVAVVLGVANWQEFEADLRALRLRVTRAPDVPRRAQVEPRKPEIRILGIKPGAARTYAIEFLVEIVNYGDRQARCSVRAAVNDEPVSVEQSVRDLLPNQPPQVVRVLVPRPELGDHMLPEIPATPATLYGRALTVVVSDGEHETRDEWREPTFDAITDAARLAVQQRYWRRGRGEETPDDLRAELLEAHERRVEGDG